MRGRWVLWFFAGLGSTALAVATATVRQGTQDRPWEPVAQSVESAPTPNSWDAVIAAARAVEETPATATAIAGRRETTPQTAAVAQDVVRNAPALKAARQALAEPWVVPAPADPRDLLADDYAALRRLARLMRAQGAVHALRGDLPGAAQSAVDGLRLGAGLSRGVGLVGLHEAAIVQAVSRSGLWALVSRLDAKQATATAYLLAEAGQANVPFAAAVAEERRLAAELVAFAVETHSWRPYAGASSAVNGYPLGDCLWFGLSAGAQREWRGLDLVAQQCLGAAKLPYADAFAALEIPRSETPALAFSPCQSALLSWTLNDVETKLLVTSLALQAYRRDHPPAKPKQPPVKPYPENLAKLVPHYLPAVPVDAFNGRALRYRPKGKAYLLYSVGPDQRDDLGHPLAGFSKTGAGGLTLTGDSRGDVVAGVNLG